MPRISGIGPENLLAKSHQGFCYPHLDPIKVNKRPSNAFNGNQNKK